MRNFKNGVLLILLTCLACQPGQPELFFRHANAEDFEEAQQVAPVLAEGLELDLWAPGPLLSNAVALTFDPSGAAYIAETSRRKSSDLDIRQHWDWMIDDLALQSIEDTRELLMQKLPTSLSDENQWIEDFNGDSIHDYRDLSIQTEYINKVWDSDGDGRADKSQQFAAGFNTMVTGIAAGILYHDDRIYLTVAPDLWCIEDKDGNGQADERQSLSHGYGIHIAFAGHDMSGLTIGPDGRIYWSIGDLGVNVTGPDGQNWKFPNQGCVMRCNPDGTNFEVFAHGLRNPQELAFDPYGNLISVDNDGDHPGEHERYVHIVEGSDSGWRIHWQYGKYNLPNESYKVWMDEGLHVPHFSGQAAYITPPLALAYDGPAGLAYNPGTALSEEWHDYFFASYFTGSSARSKIEAFQITPKGASFEIENIKNVVEGIVPTGITFAADGALYINDWKDSYDKKPEGRIWKLDASNRDKNPAAQEVQKILQEGVSELSMNELKSYMSHEDQRIRMSAQFELVKREAYQDLLDLVVNGNADLMSRLHSIWGISQLSRETSRDLSEIKEMLSDENLHVRGQVAKLLGETKYIHAEDDLIHLLQDVSASVQFFAAEALGKMPSDKSFNPLVKLLSEIKDEDPHLRHSVVYALSKISNEDQLTGLTTHPSEYVRIGAVVALRHQRSPAIVAFLEDSSDLVLAEAARAINDDFSIPEGLPDLAKSLEKTSVNNEAFTRRAINANLRIGDEASAMRLAAFAIDQKADIAMRKDALWALGYWTDPPKLDRVTGRFRPISGHNIAHAQKAYIEIFATSLERKNNAILAASIATAGRLNYKHGNAAIAHIFYDLSKNANTRMSALKTLAQIDSKELIKHIDNALSDSNIEIRKLALDILGSLNIEEKSKLPLFEKIITQNTWSEKQVAITALSKMSSNQTQNLLSDIFEKFKKGELDPEVHLELFSSIEESEFKTLKEQKLSYEKSFNKDDKLMEYQTTLYGGDVRRGLRLFRRNAAAQCIRCHKVNGNGGIVGPDLSDIGSTLTREQLLLSLVAPSDRIAPGFGTLSISLKDGSEIVGIFMSETDDMLRVKQGEEIVEYPKSEVKSSELSPSAMFNSSEVLNKSQIRDLVAYLTDLK